MPHLNVCNWKKYPNFIELVLIYSVSQLCFPIASLERKNRERERQRAVIQEKLEERKKRWERDLERQQAEQNQLVAEQEKAIKQVLNTQAGLAEEYVQTEKLRKELYTWSEMLI